MGEIISGERRIDSAALAERSARAASGLASLGVSRGDTVAVYLKNDLPFFEASYAAGLLGAPVLAHDWAMSGIRPYPTLQHALDLMEPPGHGAVGWSILRALARSQLRRSATVILDGVARAPEVEKCDQVAHEEGARLIVLLTECADAEVHRSRIEGRHRSIPDWYELDWDHVQRSRRSWEPPTRVDLTLQAANPRHINSRMVRDFLATIESGESSSIGEE